MNSSSSSQQDSSSPKTHTMSGFSSLQQKSNMESQDLRTLKSFKANVYCNKGHIMTLEHEPLYEEPEKCDDCGETLDLPFYDCEECE